MTLRVDPAKYGGVWYHVVTLSPGVYTLAKRQGERVFAQYAVYRKEWRDNAWLECDMDLCPSARHRGALDCKHVKIVEAHLETGERESAVRWIK